VGQGLLKLSLERAHFLESERFAQMVGADRKVRAPGKVRTSARRFQHSGDSEDVAQFASEL